MKEYKIAIITAFIGNGGKTGELKFTPEAQAQLDTYGVDIYRFNDDNIGLLKPYYEPIIKKEDIISESIWNKIVKAYGSIKYKQEIVPSEKDNYTRLIAKIPKILFYKLIPHEYDYYIWLDSKFIIHENWLDYVLWLISNHESYDIIASKHSERNSVKEEVSFMLGHIKKQNKGMCEKYIGVGIACQFESYSKKFIDNRLFELTMIIFSKNIIKKKEFLEDWYSNNYYFSIQDQISFAYLINKHHINVWQIPQYVFNMPFTEHEYGIK